MRMISEIVLQRKNHWLSIQFLIANAKATASTHKAVEESLLQCLQNKHRDTNCNLWSSIYEQHKTILWELLHSNPNWVNMTKHPCSLTMHEHNAMWNMSQTNNLTESGYWYTRQVEKYRVILYNHPFQHMTQPRHNWSDFGNSKCVPCKCKLKHQRLVILWSQNHPKICSYTAMLDNIAKWKSFRNYISGAYPFVADTTISSRCEQ